MTDIRPKLYAGLLLVFSVCAALFLGEVVLRTYSSDDYFVWHPNLEKVFKPLPDIMPGISGESRFTVNASGMRGDPFPEDDRHRILTIGGSTTECHYLDQSEAWPQLLQDKLNNLEELGVWVGNVGASVITQGIIYSKLISYCNNILELSSSCYSLGLMT